MPSYKYRVRGKDGALQAGVVDAPGLDEAAGALEERGLEILLLEPYSTPINQRALAFLNRVKPKDLVIMSRQLAVMVSAAIPLVEAIRNIARQTENPKLREIMLDVSTEVEGGARISDALERHSKVFSGFFVNMIRSGETSGQLEEVLEYLADQQEKDYDLTSKIRSALIYPAFILSALVVVGFIMMSFVVPQLTQILQEANVQLPLSTRILIAVSGFFKTFWWLILIGMVGAIIGAKVAVQTPGGRLVWDGLKLKLPIFSILFRNIYVVRFTRSLATLLHGGVDQISALEICAGIVGNQHWKNMVYETIKEVNEGNSITTAFARSKYVPGMMTQMLSVGEETGKLQEVLKRVADFFNREVDNTVANLVVLIEPIVMILLGVAVGVMVSAILLPLYQLSSGV